MPKKVTPETALKRASTKLLAMFRVWTFPVLQGLGAYKGIADRLGIWEKGVCPHCGGQVSQPLAIEFKSPEGTLSDKQKEFQWQWVSRGGIYVPVKQVEDLVSELKLPCHALW